MPPEISAALDEGAGDLEAQLAAIRERSSTRPRYTLLGEVGTGGMGRVLRVWDEVLQRELAMKVLSHPPPGEDAEAREEQERRLQRFLGEARITGQLDHPGIVPVHELSMDENGELFFTMPLVRGMTLAKVFACAREGREGWNLHKAVDVLQRVCMTVAFAHSRGVIHRDLKPDNIMVGPFGEAFVMDWGLSHVGERAGSRRVMGTPAYMAPEQFSDPESVDPRSDVYSLGAILYELLAGEIPHEQTFAEVQDGTDLSECLRAPPRRIDELRADIPPELGAICAKAMESRMDRRYASALELAEDVSAWLEHRVVQASDPSRWTRIRKWSERNRGLARALEALVLLALLATTAISLQQQKRIRTVQAKNRAIEAGTYAANLHSASLHLRNLEVNDARIRLAACPPSLRGFEWEFLDYLSDSSERILPPIDSQILSVDGSTQSDIFAIGSENGSIHIFDAAGNPTSTVSNLGGPVDCLRFLPGTALFLSITRGSAVTLWNAATGSRVRDIGVPSTTITTLAVSEDAAFFAVGNASGNVRLYRSADDSLVARFASSDGPVSSVCFSPDGTRVAVGHSSGYLTLWNRESKLAERRVLLQSDSVHSIAYHSNGLVLFAAVGTKVVQLDASRLAQAREFSGHKGLVTSVDVDSSGHLLTSSSDGTIRLWNLSSGTEESLFSGHLDEVYTAVFLADGTHVLSGSEDRTARIWSLEIRPERSLMGHGDWVTSVAFSPLGGRIASASRDGTVRVWNADNGQCQATLPLSNATDFVAWRSENVLALAGPNGAPEFVYPFEERPWELYPGDMGAPTTMVFAPLSSSILATYANGRALLWRPPAKEPQLDITIPGEVFAASFDTTGGVFAIGDFEGRVTTIDPTTGRELRRFRGARSPILSLAFAPHRNVLAACTRDRRILLWSLASGELIRVLEGHESQLTALAFSPDEKRLVSGSVDSTLRIWNPDSGEALLTLRGHGAEITAIRISPDGTRICSASKDRTVRVWRTRPAPAN